MKVKTVQIAPVLGSNVHRIVYEEMGRGTRGHKAKFIQFVPSEEAHMYKVGQRMVMSFETIDYAKRA